MQKQGITLEAKNIHVCRKGKLILNDVSFTVRPGTLTAIIGPNGAGKTTLMRALAGERPDSGHVLINGEEMYADPQYWLQQIGYVPDHNILHEHLTLQEALVYIGRLRLPDVALEQIESKVDSLLAEFGFEPGDARRQKLIGVLSNGERKRANVCSELIIDPPLLLLDEPTSGLDPDAERNLMRLLRDYVDDKGQTILVITHTLNTIDVCHEVIFLENARLQAAGDRDRALEELESKIADQTQSHASSFYRWARVFEHYETDEKKRESCSEVSTIRGGASMSRPRRQPASAPWPYQLRCLLSRYVKVQLGDKWSLIGTLLAGLSGVLFFILPGNTFIEPVDASEVALALNQARQSVYVVSLVVTLIGLITSYTEVSKEFYIYKHERLKGLSPFAYFMSKWTWLTAAVGILAPIILVAFIVVVYRQPLPGFPEPRIGEVVGWWEQLFRFQIVGLLTRRTSWLILTTLVLACITSVTLGLLISVVAGGSGRGYLYLSFTVVFIVLFSGLIRNERLEQLVDYLSSFSTGKWAFEGFASSVGLYCWLDSWRFDEFNSTGHIVSVWLSLGIFTLAAAFVAIVALRLRDPWYSHWTNLGRLFTQERTRIMMSLAVLAVLLSHTLFLRQRSHEFHSLNYFSRQEYGGTNALEYPNVQKVQDLDLLQYWNGRISQSWCGDR
ncbi:MAG: ATP-binding cassette domain-containing protein [Anaerolineales bacterium]|nr:ATP-binding cassette domain-containing protein [Anaerolineales bacterium]